MSTGPFSPSQFIPTKWSTAEEKARFGNALLHLIDSGFARNLFTDRLYSRLSNCFGHIAHYNSTGFYEEWFLSQTAQVRFLEHTLRFPATEIRSSRFRTWSVRFSGRSATGIIFRGINCSLAEEQRGAELTLLERLEGKYRSRREDPQEGPASTPPGNVGEAVEPVQGLLF